MEYSHLQMRKSELSDTVYYMHLTFKNLKEQSYYIIQTIAKQNYICITQNV